MAGIQAERIVVRIASATVVTMPATSPMTVAATPRPRRTANAVKRIFIALLHPPEGVHDRHAAGSHRRRARRQQAARDRRHPGEDQRLRRQLEGAEEVAELVL